jgi:hypothetical protein
MQRPWPPFDPGTELVVRRPGADPHATYIVLDPAGVLTGVTVRGSDWQLVPKWAGERLREVEGFEILTEAEHAELG